MTSSVTGELVSETVATTPGATGRANVTSQEHRDTARWLSRGGIAQGTLNTSSVEITLPPCGQTQRRLIAISNGVAGSAIQLRAISRQPGSGFEWAGGLPDEPIDIRSYAWPPLQEDSIVNPLGIEGLYVNTGTPEPDECLRFQQCRDGAYIYVYGEERDTFQIRRQGEEQP